MSVQFCRPEYCSKAFVEDNGSSSGRISVSLTLFLQEILPHCLLGILVRDDASLKRLQEKTGNIGVIMYVFFIPHPDALNWAIYRTLYDSKGQEFDDVSSFSKTFPSASKNSQNIGIAIQFL